MGTAATLQHTPDQVSNTRLSPAICQHQILQEPWGRIGCSASGCRIQPFSLAHITSTACLCCKMLREPPAHRRYSALHGDNVSTRSGLKDSSGAVTSVQSSKSLQAFTGHYCEFNEAKIWPHKSCCCCSSPLGVKR